jgi:hypothetical protein
MKLIVQKGSAKHLERHFAKRTEQVAFLFLTETRPDQFECKDIFLVPSGDLVNESEVHSEVSERAVTAVLKKATAGGFCLCEIHSHPFSKSDTQFSYSDKAGFAEFVPHIWWRLKGRPYFAIVLGQRECDALGWLKNPLHPDPVSEIQFGSKRYEPTGLSYRQLASEIAKRERYARQEYFFGKDGQRKLEKTRVAIVGVGGIGSHIAQQLAYVGVNDFILLDNDKVDGTNLNRLIGATEKDLYA